jgi:hypothetical protein
MEDLEKRKFFTLPGLELRSLGREARSQSLYRLRYNNSLFFPVFSYIISSKLAKEERVALLSMYGRPGTSN